MNHVEAVAGEVVNDVIAYVKAHPDYQRIVAQLGEKALAALAAEARL